MRTRTVIGVMVLALCGTACLSATDSEEEAAQTAAVAWLDLVDAGRYDASWDGAAALFKRAVTQGQWNQSIRGVREPLGRLVSRTVRSRHYKESLPGAPDGRYVVIQFDAVYEKKAEAVETVTPMMDADGTWRVSGYFIR